MNFQTLARPIRIMAKFLDLQISANETDRSLVRLAMYKGAEVRHALGFMPPTGVTPDEPYTERD